MLTRRHGAVVPRLAAHAVGDDAAAQHTGDGTESGPRGVADQPEAGGTRVVRQRVLVAVAQRLPHAADRAAGAERPALVAARRADHPHHGPVAEARVRAAGVPDQPVAEFELARLVLRLGQPGPVGQLGVGGDHHSAVPGRCAVRVAGRGDRHEHVVPRAQRPPVVLEELVVGERLPGDLVLGYAQEHHRRAAQALPVASQEQSQPGGDRGTRRDGRRVGGRQRADHLAGGQGAAPGPHRVPVAVAAHPLDRAAQPQPAAQLPVPRDERAPEAVHAAAVPGQAGAPDGDPERGVDQRCPVDRAVHGVLDEHGEQADERGVLAQPVPAQRVAERPARVPAQRHPPQSDGAQVVQRVDRSAHG